MIAPMQIKTDCSEKEYSSKVILNFQTAVDRLEFQSRDEKWEMMKSTRTNCLGGLKKPSKKPSKKPLKTFFKSR
jgi:hypothetical protein